MITVLSLLAVFVLLDLVVLAGWAPSTRDGRDWTVPQHGGHRRSVPSSGC